MKKTIIISMIILIISSVTAFYFLKKENKNNKDNLEQQTYQQTLDISKKYLSLRYRTDNILLGAKNYPNYENWNSEMGILIEDWKKIEVSSVVLEKNADELAEEKISLDFISPVFAYEKQEISDIFDKAPAGKKIATLAKFLNVDAKRAYKILQQDQNQVTADAWNEAGETLQNLETSATVIKDGCKIAGFVGGIVISGGTSAIAAGSTLAKATVIVTGADLTLEVSEDGANIALGNHNRISAIIGDARKITEPISTLLNINAIPSNLKTGLEKFDVAMIAIDQFRGVVQDGKIVGVALPVYTKDKTKVPVKVAVLEKEEVDSWLKDNGVQADVEDKKTVEEILGLSTAEKMSSPITTPSNQVNAPAEEVGTPTKVSNIPAEGTNASSQDTNALLGTWAGTLQNTPGGGGGSAYYKLSMDLNADGTVSFTTGLEDFEFLTWKQFGDAVRLYGEDPSGVYYEFNHQGNSLALIKTVMFGTEYLAGGPGIMGGKALEGTLTKQ